MTVQEAKQIVKRLSDEADPTGEEMFELTEALGFLIEETHDPRYMMHLGGIYYEEQLFDLALKYYEMAAAYDYEFAYECLGYIWYYGRTGERDFEKAFVNYSKAAEKGNLVARYKIADMYKNGYFVEQDYGKYCEIIESLYPEVEGAEWTNIPLPEVYIRLAKIRAEQGNTEEAVRLLMDARDFLTQRIIYNPFFGDLSNMSWLISELYELIEFDPADFSLYDLYHVLRTPCKVRFRCGGKAYEVESVMENGNIAVRFGDRWYRSVRDFFGDAAIDGKRLVTITRRLYGFTM